MSDEIKTKIIKAVEIIEPDSKSELYLAIKDTIEKHVPKKRPRIHISDDTCLACQA